MPKRKESSTSNEGVEENDIAVCLPAVQSASKQRTESSGSGDEAVQSASKQRTESSGSGDEAVQSASKRRRTRSSGGGDEAGASLPMKEPLLARQAKHILFEKHKKTNILVDRIQGRKPVRVYFVQTGDYLCNEESQQPVDKDDYFVIKYHRCEDTISPRSADSGNLEFLSPLWREKITPAISSNPDYQDAQTVLEGLGDALRFDMVNERWNPTEHEANYVAMSSKVLKKNPLVGYSYNSTRMVDAFARRMTNSAGKSALQSIIDLATTVSFGRDAVRYEELVMSFTFGSADKSEKFPVNQAPGSMCLSSVGRPEYVRAVKRTRTYSDTSSGSANSVMLLELPSGGIYADILTVSGCQPNFPHFVIVGEVKSSDHVNTKFPFSESVEAQLICEMLGAMLHQSYVIGILFNDRGARLFGMQMNFAEKKISVTAKDYCFMDKLVTRFCSSKLIMLFSDLVFAFEYCKEQIKQIQHWPAE